MKRPLLDIAQHRTVRAVSAAMRIAQVCEVCRIDFATHADPPTCDACHAFMCDRWQADAPPPTRMELRATG